MSRTDSLAPEAAIFVRQPLSIADNLWLCTHCTRVLLRPGQHSVRCTQRQLGLEHIADSRLPLLDRSAVDLHPDRLAFICQCTISIARDSHERAIFAHPHTCGSCFDRGVHSANAFVAKEQIPCSSTVSCGTCSIKHVHVKGGGLLTSPSSAQACLLCSTPSHAHRSRFSFVLYNPTYSRLSKLSSILCRSYLPSSHHNPLRISRWCSCQRSFCSRSHSSPARTHSLHGFSRLRGGLVILRFPKAVL